MSNKQNKKQQPTVNTAPKENYHERCVRIAFVQGKIPCQRVDHHVLVRNPGDKYPAVSMKNPSGILKLMRIRSEASCECERSSCEWAWNNQDRLGLMTDQFVPFGKYYRGFNKLDVPNKSVVVPAYAMENVKTLHQYFPNVQIVVSPSSPTHDHPISHTVTEIGRRQLYDALPRGTSDAPKRYLDLHGSPKIAISYSRNNVGVVIETMVEIKTPKDVLRAKKWGTGPTIHRSSFSKLPLSLKRSFDGFISVHTGYYYDNSFYDELFTTCPDATLHLLMHRFDQDDGMINDELRYKKFSKNGIVNVQQLNANGSDSYVHPDNAFWFEKNSTVVGKNGMVWSTNQICPGTWSISACSCDPSLVEPPTKLAHQLYNSTQSFVDVGRVSANVGTYVIESSISLNEAEFFDELRLWISLRPRSEAIFKDYVARYKSKLSGPRKLYTIDSQLAKRLALVAFFIDSKEESSVLPAFFEQIRDEIVSLETMRAPNMYLLDRFMNIGMTANKFLTFREPFRSRARSYISPHTIGLPAYAEID